MIFAAVVQIESASLGSLVTRVGKAVATAVGTTAVIEGGQKVLDKIKG
jgi:hypothetical protein